MAALDSAATADIGDRKKDIAHVPSLRAQRSQESALAHKVVEMRRQPSGSLVRSNSAVARAAAAIKELQSDAAQEEEEERAAATPDHAAEKPQQPRFTPRATVPTLRDMILYRQSPAKPPLQDRQRTPPLTATNIDTALGSLSLDAASRKQKRTVSDASSRASADTTRSEEDVRQRLQRIRIALGRADAAGAGEREQGDALLRIEAALSPDSAATAADIAALCHDIDEVESMLQSGAASPPVAERCPAGEDGEEERVESAGVSSDADRASPGKRKHSDDEKAPQVRQLKAPPAVARGRGRGKVRGAALHAVHKQQQQQGSGIPRRPAGAPTAAAAAIPPRTHSRVPLSA
ncbi:hypothetical protein H4S06_006692, partial [Coemansia sp. BCRC 34490]